MLKRFSIAVDDELLSRFDLLLTEEGYSNRSEAVRDLIRDTLVKREWESEDTVTVGTVILVYDHHKHELMEKLTDIQHEAQDLVVASLHTHLDHRHCQEIIVMRGSVRQMRRVSAKLIAARGVKFGQLVGSTTATEL